MRTLRQRRDGWWCTVETKRTIREYGPYETRAEANHAGTWMARPSPITPPTRLATPAPSPTPETPETPEKPVLAKSQLAMIDRYRPLFNRVDASDLELAAAIKTLSEAGIGQTVMAQQFGSRNQSWFSYMYRLSQIPESLVRYLRNDQISMTALTKGVGKLGVVAMERLIPAILARHARQGIKAKIIERELYE